MQDGQYVLLGQAPEREDTAAREEGANDFKTRVFGGGTDERYGAAFDMGQDGILLRFIEAVDLVDEEDGALPGELAQFAGIFHHLA